MAMVGVDSGSLYRRSHSLSRLAWSWVGGRRRTGVPRRVGSGEGCPQKNLKFNSANLFIFPRFQDGDNSSIRCFSFIYCLYLFLSSPSEISIAFCYFTQHTPAKSTAHLTKSTAHFVSENTQFQAMIITSVKSEVMRSVQVVRHSVILSIILCTVLLQK